MTGATISCVQEIACCWEKETSDPGFRVDNLLGKGTHNFCFSTRSKRASNGDGGTGLGGPNDRESTGEGTSGMDRRKVGREANKVCNRTYTAQWTIGGGLRGSTGAPKNIGARD